MSADNFTKNQFNLLFEKTLRKIFVNIFSIVKGGENNFILNNENAYPEIALSYSVSCFMPFNFF
ncbi:hypothetical protein BH11BAC1_BH11BAC1_27510 [soil metagenome]